MTNYQVGNCFGFVEKEKQGKQNMCHGKDGYKIGLRHTASAGKGKKEQTWSEKDLDKAFDI